MKNINRLFVGNKPEGVSSAKFLNILKKKYNIKKAGYSGTLDPFASGVLIVAFGQYTKLFNYLEKTPKRYQATLFLGAYSPTLDSEKIEYIDNIPIFDKSDIESTLLSLKGELEYLPPKYSAKNVNGQRAYDLARKGEEFRLNKIKSFIYDIKLLDYTHPYITFDISISEGGYIRSIGQIISQKLGTHGALKKLIRICEGSFIYDDEKELSPLKYLRTKENFYLSDKFDILLGRKLKSESFKFQSDDIYHIVLDKELSIIQIKNKEVKYLLNKIRLQGC